jgi:hypothetical protein
MTTTAGHSFYIGPIGSLDFKLNFNEHISNICKKASMQLNVLKRIGKHLTKLGKLTIYYSLIMSNFNNCPLTCKPCNVVLTCGSSAIFCYLEE